MASIVREIVIDAAPGEVWVALRDVDHPHERLARGFVVDARSGGDGIRTVTFFNGAVAREALVGIDDANRRLAYCVVGSALGLAHHSASAQVFPSGDARSRLVWITDVLPDAAATAIAEFMDRGIAAIRETTESQHLASRLSGGGTAT